ncbi:SCO1664 family protein [Brachybacterium sp. YJGR34]|uniref:SCO1664 family protein n=1 Tax=Brachybacterium sp. YJGR34 TaxID=2059911 RepID=UPI000E0B6263|nr:SCO1664 family protein [Brachybacterium sp. YJGR34]
MTAEDAARELLGAARPGAEGELLASGEILPIARLVSSNQTFLVEIRDGQDAGWAVYKPVLGERPLEDFPPGLHRRERAAYLLSESLGWGLVPETVVREDGPFGVGSLQRFVAADPEEHYFTLLGRDPGTDDALRRLAVFDLLVRNTDRKAGHVLLDDAERIWGIDHGLCFHPHAPLRTVIWDFAGEAIDPGLVEDAAALIDEVPAVLAAVLEPEEIRGLRGRARFLLAAGALPEDATGMAFPWPLI